jgi:hypothetical protein
MIGKKFYKVLSKDLKAKDGGDFDYSKYVKSGEWTPTIECVSQCNRGYHVTPYWNMWVHEESNRVFEVEVKGLVDSGDVGVVDKFVCESIRFVEELKPIYDNKLNTGNSNTGDNNTGDNNTGYRNTGYIGTLVIVTLVIVTLVIGTLVIETLVIVTLVNGIILTMKLVVLILNKTNTSIFLINHVL